MLRTPTPVQFNNSPSPETPIRSFSVTQSQNFSFLQKCQEPTKKKKNLTRSKSNLVSQSTKLAVLFSKPDAYMDSVQNNQLNKDKVPKNGARGSKVIMNSTQYQKFSNENPFRIPYAKSLQNLYLGLGPVKINPAFQITVKKKEDINCWTNEEKQGNCSKSIIPERVAKTSFAVTRLKKLKKDVRDCKDKFIVFPELQTPIRDVKKNDQDHKNFNKSFSDLKDLPIYRLSIENNTYSKLRKFRGRLK